MTAPLSQDLRRRIVQAVETGSSARQAAARSAVSPSASVKLMRRVREPGSPAPGQVGGHRRPMLEPHADLIQALVAGRPRITLAELQAPWLANDNLCGGPAGAWGHCALCPGWADDRGGVPGLRQAGARS